LLVFSLWGGADAKNGGTATLVRVNDMRGHTAVLSLFDKVIAAAGG
jgi:hypothetical protein